MGNPTPIMCFYKIPKGVGEPPMTFEEFTQRVEYVEQEWGSIDGKPRMTDMMKLYEGYVEECKELNCCEVEVKGFATMSDQVDETFAKIKEKEPDAILIEPEKESNDE